MLQIPELLAPAGDAERLRYAINYGADAVYCGLPEFGMRSAPANFTPEQLTESVIYAHARGRKVYLTMNTLPTNEEADRLPEAIKEAAKAGVDAFIVADLGVLDACKTFAPDIDVHMSTQTGITNWAAARTGRCWHFIDSTGAVAIDCSDCNAVKPFANGRAIVVRDGQRLAIGRKEPRTTLHI